MSSIQVDSTELATTESYAEKVRSSLEKTGFPLEIMTAGYFEISGWSLIDHAYYIDKDENKGREIDLIAFKNHTTEMGNKSLNVSVALTIEVKKNSTRPWIVMTSKRRPSERTDSFFDTMLVRMHHEEIWFQELYANHHLASEQRLGRIAFQTFGKDESTTESKKEKTETSTPSSALLSCFKALSEIEAINKMEHTQTLRQSDGKKTYIVSVSHGLVVIGGDLFEGRVDASGSCSVVKRDYIPCVVSYASEKYGYKTRIIDVITFNYLNEYLLRYHNWGMERSQFSLAHLHN